MNQPVTTQKATRQKITHRITQVATTSAFGCVCVCVCVCTFVCVFLPSRQLLSWRVCYAIYAREAREAFLRVTSSVSEAPAIALSHTRTHTHTLSYAQTHWRTASLPPPPIYTSQSRTN